MKVLYCNPIFLDYRLPFYKRLNELFNGDFHVMYSVCRYKGRYDHLFSQIPKVMGENAHPFDGERLFNTHEMSFKYNIEKGKKIPLTWGLMSEIRKIDPDVLITEGFFQWTPLVLLYSIIFRKPMFIGYERTPWTERNTGILKTWHRKLTDKFVTGYLVNGSETKKYLMSIGVKEDKIHIGGMSADSEGLRSGIGSMTEEEKRAIREKYNKGGLLFLFCGQIVKRKGVSYLLEAWNVHVRKHPDDSLVLIGTGDLLEEFRTQYADVPSIHLEGRVNYTDVHKYYAVADVFVLPTIEDNWSLVIPEAMSCGLPVATSIYNGCHPELVHEGENGITFDTFKQESILKALDYFHHVDLGQFGQNSIKLEEQFNTENSARREYEGIMKGLSQR